MINQAIKINTLISDPLESILSPYNSQFIVFYYPISFHTPAHPARVMGSPMLKLPPQSSAGDPAV
jgi:hypothetical protein